MDQGNRAARQLVEELSSGLHHVAYAGGQSLAASEGGSPVRKCCSCPVHTCYSALMWHQQHSVSVRKGCKPAAAAAGGGGGPNGHCLTVMSLLPEEGDSGGRSWAEKHTDQQNYAAKSRSRFRLKRHPQQLNE